MSIRFAGSRCVDERRRRRLAQEADAQGEFVSHTVSGSRGAADDPSAIRAASPADSLIPPRLWKHLALAVVGMACWAGVIVAGHRADQARSGLQSIIGLSAGKLTTFFSTVMLLAAGQLALITLWYRSRSRKDFSGSYKLWFWTAAGWLTLCAFRATGVHWILADAVLAGRPVAIWNARLVVWLIPTAIVVASLYRLLLREMRECALSLWTMRISGVLALSSGLALVFGPFVWRAGMELLITAALTTGWHLLLAISMLLHARHVIHETNEPPQTPIVRWDWRMDWFQLPFRRSATRAASLAKEAKPTRSKARRSTPRKSESRSSAARANPAPTNTVEAEEPTAEQENPAETPAPVVSRPQPVGEVPPTVSRRVDAAQSGAKAKPHFIVPAATSVTEEPDEDRWTDGDAADTADDRELSKKERRRQKKLSRQR